MPVPDATPLPAWTAAGSDGDMCLDVTIADQVRVLARALGEPQERLVLAATVRIASMLAAEDDVTIGHQAARTQPMVPLRVRLPGGSWRDLIAAVKADAVGAVLTVGDSLRIWCTGTGISLRCRASQFDSGYLDRFGGYLTAALAAMAADPDAPWPAADLLSAAERHHLLAERAGAARSLPDEPAHRQFARQARERPDATAVLYLAERWTYDQVNRAANQIAHALLAAGLRAEDVVAVGTERGPRWLCAILGVLKAGGCYLPIEPDYPAGRVAELVSRAEVKFALTEPAGLAGPGAASGLWSRPVTGLLGGDYPDADPAVEVAPGQLAYVYFTSGSTGAPKGAMCEHLGMVNHLTAKVDDFGIGPGDVVVQNARQSFDISLWQLVAPLTVGGATLILPAGHSLDPRLLIEAMVGNDATVLQVVPAFLDVLLRYLEQHPRDLGKLRLVCVTGEAITKPLVVRWFAACPRIALVNAFGATEASDDTTHEIMWEPPPGELVPVGRPVCNVTAYVLGPGDRLRPLGTPGEIAYSGVCVGRGYINDPERTAEAFADDPFRPGHRLYRTGDYGRWLPSGSLEFHGRKDEQVKIQGVRIELGEIEARVTSHPRVLAASVVVTTLPDGAKSLAAFYTSGGGLDPAGLREHLAASLPPSAMPARIERIESLPLTANGKVDKRSLVTRALAAQAPAGARGRPAPRTPSQQRIAAAWALAMNRPVDEIGLDDSFFDIGGSSLAALRVVASLDGLIGLDDLVRNPVLSALAAVADGERGEAGGLLRLLAGPAAGPSAALVCVPYAAGTAISFQALASALAALDGGIAVYAVQPPGHDLGQRAAPLAELDELTKPLASEVAGIGVPVALWGHCAGAPAALEAARLLGGAVTHVFVGARLLEPRDELAKENAMLSTATDIELGAELAGDGGLDGLAGLSQEELAFVGRVYRHDTRTANQYLIRRPEPRLGCPLTVVASATDPLTGGCRERFTDWGAFSDQVTLAELADGGHYFPRTRPEQTAAVILRALRPLA
jgi:amino acid adenylation domain-containing protein